LIIHDGVRIEGNTLKDIKLIQAYNNGTETLLEYLQELITQFGIPHYEDPPYPEPRTIKPWKDDFIYETDKKQNASNNISPKNALGDAKLKAMQSQMQQHMQKKLRPRDNPRTTAPAPAPSRGNPSSPKPVIEIESPQVIPAPDNTPLTESIDQVQLEWVSTTTEVLSARLMMAIENITVASQAEQLQPFVNQLRQLKLENTKALNFVKIQPTQPTVVDHKFERAKMITICGFKDSLSIIEAFADWSTKNPSPEQFEEAVQIIRAIKDIINNLD
jgi:hypothetical protein